MEDGELSVSFDMDAALAQQGLTLEKLKAPTKKLAPPHLCLLESLDCEARAAPGGGAP